MSVTIMQLKFQTRKFAPGGVCYCRCGAWRPATRGSALQGSRSLVVLQLIRYTLFRSRAWCAYVGAIPQQTLQPDSASCPPRCARASSLPRRLPLRPCRRHQLPQAGRADRRQSTAQLMTGSRSRVLLQRSNQGPVIPLADSLPLRPCHGGAQEEVPGQ